MVGPLVEKSVNVTTLLQLTLSLTSKYETGGAVGKLQVQSASNPLPFTAWSECNKIVIAPLLETIVPGLPVNTLQY